MKKIVAAAAAGLLALSIAGCSGTKGAKNLNGKAGETLSTMFFDYTVTTYRLEDEMQGMLGHDGYKLLVVDVTVTNNGESPITMSDADFFISWGDGEKDYDYPISMYTTTQLSERQLPAKYNLDAAASKSGELIFAVPPDKTEFGLKTQDYYTEGDSSEPVEGDIYTVSFKIGEEAAPAEGSEAPAEESSEESNE